MRLSDSYLEIIIKMASTPILVRGIDLLRDLGFYDVIIPGALIIAATYAVLMKIQILGDNKGINMVLAITTALIIISFSPAVEILSLFIVYSLMLFSVIMFLLLMLAFMGLKEKDFATAAKESGVYNALIVGMVIIAIIVVTQALPAFGDNTGTTGLEPIMGSDVPAELNEGDLLLAEGLTGSPGSTTQTGIDVVFNPAVLSVIIMLLIFAGASIMITKGRVS